jgi:hypothetical protein
MRFADKKAMNSPVLVCRASIPLTHLQVLDYREQELHRQHGSRVPRALRVYRGLRVRQYRISGAA